MDNSASKWTASCLNSAASALAGVVLATSAWGAAELPMISSLAQLHSLSAQELTNGRRVQLEGIVLCHDSEWHQLAFQTREGTIFMDPAGLGANPKPGDSMKINGQTVLTTDGLSLTNLSGTVLAHPGLPAATQIQISDLATTGGEWIEIQARVRLAETSRGRLGLWLGDGNNPCVAYILGPAPTNDCKSYVGALMRLRGFNGSHIFNGRVTEAVLSVPDATQISILTPAAASLASIPVASIDFLLNRELGPWTNEPVHLNGLVSAVIPGESLLLKDPTGIIQARLRQVNEVAVGQRVDLWGYLQAAADQPVLADAYFEPVRSAPAAVPPPQPAAPTAELGLKVCTNLAQLRTLSREQVARGVRIKVRGTVVYSDPEWNSAFIHDGNASVYVDPKQSGISVGQWVELTGRATTGRFAPIILPTDFRILGQTNLPAPLPADLGDLADGSLDAQWIEIRGVVRRAKAEWNHLHLSIMSRQGQFNVLVPGFPGTNPPASLIDSFVSLRGICGSDPNARSQISGITIYVPGLRQIQTLKPAASDAFGLPATPMAAVATFDPDQVAGGRIKVVGVVSLNIPGQGLYVQDASGGIRVQTGLAQSADVCSGDAVEVLGFPALGEFSPHLEEATVHRVGTTRRLLPLTTTAEQILLNGTNDATLLRLEARLLQRVPRSAQPKVILQQGAIIFTAQLVSGHFSQNVGDWPPNSLLQLTGVCAIQGTEDHSPQSFKLLLANPDAVELLQAPSVWSVRTLLIVAGTLGLVGLSALSWIASLRRQVRARTAALSASQASLQRQADHNHALSELGRRLSAAATPKDAALIVVEVADRLVGWDACMCDLYSPETDRVSHVLAIDLIEGRRVESPPETTNLRPSALARRAIEAGAQLVLRQPGQINPADGIPFGEPARRSASILYVPIRHGAIVVGLLSIQSYSFQAYTQQDLSTLQALADHCSGALGRIRAHQKLVEISRHAGMAEVATGVLHNVGNVLNSVNVSVALLLEAVNDSHATRLGKVAQLLQAHRHDPAAFLTGDPKGRKLLAYLEQLPAVMAAGETRFRAELEGLAKNVEHIKDIVAMQQSYARLAGAIESLSPADLVEDAVRLNAGTLSRHRVQICRDYPAHLTPVTTDKHKVLQILINLIRNAKYACNESGRRDKQLTLSIANGDGRVRISVADNGVGIVSENLARIFSLGFSTRKSGHGFGLHSAALAARELGGSLTVQSDGPGRGATFTLELPLSISN